MLPMPEAALSGRTRWILVNPRGGLARTRSGSAAVVADACGLTPGTRVDSLRAGVLMEIVLLKG